MNPEIKAKWVEALRSGEYQQGHGMLRNRDKYCCLGVLQIVINNGDESKVQEGGHYLGVEDVRLAGIYGLKVQTPLVELNDTEGKTFPEIADYIEKNL